MKGDFSPNTGLVAKSTLRRHVAWAVWTLVLAVAYKLATQGVLGSDLYAGFFNADQHFLIKLPLEHVFNAASFKAFGPGVAQMRWVSVVAGVALIWTVSWLAYRWYGLATAVI